MSWGSVGLFLFWSTRNSGTGARLKLIPIEHVGFGGHVSIQFGFSFPHPNSLGTQIQEPPAIAFVLGDGYS